MNAFAFILSPSNIWGSCPITRLSWAERMTYWGAGCPPPPPPPSPFPPPPLPPLPPPPPSGSFHLKALPKTFLISSSVVMVAAIVVLLVVALIVVIVIVVCCCIGLSGVVGVWSGIIWLVGLILACWSSSTANSLVDWSGISYWCMNSFGCVSVAFPFGKSI